MKKLTIVISFLYAIACIICANVIDDVVSQSIFWVGAFHFSLEGYKGIDNIKS